MVNSFKEKLNAPRPASRFTPPKLPTGTARSGTMSLDAQCSNSTPCRQTSRQRRLAVLPPTCWPRLGPVASHQQQQHQQQQQHLHHRTPLFRASWTRLPALRARMRRPRRVIPAWQLRRRRLRRPLLRPLHPRTVLQVVCLVVAQCSLLRCPYKHSQACRSCQPPSRLPSL